MESIKSSRYSPIRYHGSNNTASSPRRETADRDVDRRPFDSKNDKKDHKATRFYPEQKLEENRLKRQGAEIPRFSDREASYKRSKFDHTPSSAYTYQAHNSTTSRYGNSRETSSSRAEYRDSSYTSSYYSEPPNQARGRQLQQAARHSEYKDRSTNISTSHCRDAPLYDSGRRSQMERGGRSYMPSAQAKQPHQHWESEINAIFSARTLKDFVESMQQASRITKTAQHRSDDWFRKATEHFRKVVKESPRDQLEKYWAINLGRVLYSFKQFSGGGEGVSGFLSCIAELLSDDRKPMLGPQEISNALYGLQHLTASDATEAVLKAIAPHIHKANQLSPQEIGNALYGLQQLTASDATEAILEAITKHIIAWVSAPQPFAIFRAETIRSLAVLLQYKSTQALHLVNTLSNKFSDEKEINKLDSLDQQEKYLIDVLNQPFQKIDLHGLAEFYVSAVLKHSLSSSLTVIYGRGSHSKHSDNKMKATVEQALSNNLEYQNELWKADWSAGRVTISRCGDY